MWHVNEVASWGWAALACLKMPLAVCEEFNANIANK
jgi:hypothetical protein